MGLEELIKKHHVFEILLVKPRTAIIVYLSKIQLAEFGENVIDEFSEHYRSYEWDTATIYDVESFVSLGLCDIIFDGSHIEGASPSFESGGNPRYVDYGRTQLAVFKTLEDSLKYGIMENFKSYHATYESAMDRFFYNSLIVDMETFKLMEKFGIQGIYSTSEGKLTLHFLLHDIMMSNGVKAIHAFTGKYSDYEWSVTDKQIGNPVVEGCIEYGKRLAPRFNIPPEYHSNYINELGGSIDGRYVVFPTLIKAVDLFDRFGFSLLSSYESITYEKALRG